MKYLIAVLFLLIAVSYCQECPSGYVKVDANTCVSSITEPIAGCRYHYERKPALCQKCEDQFWNYGGYCICRSGKTLVKNVNGDISCIHPSIQPIRNCAENSREYLGKTCHKCRPDYYPTSENGVDKCTFGRIPGCEVYQNQNTCYYCDSVLSASKSYGYDYVNNKCRMFTTKEDCYKYNENGTCEQYYGSHFVKLDDLDCPTGQVYVHKQKKCVVGSPIKFCKYYNTINECGDCGRNLGFMEQLKINPAVDVPGVCAVPPHRKIAGCTVHHFRFSDGQYTCADAKFKEGKWKQGEENQEASGPKQVQNSLKMNGGSIVQFGLVVLLGLAAILF